MPPRRRLLLVEPSTAMRQVLEKHLRELGHAIDAVGDYGEGLAALERRGRVFSEEYALVLFGWPVRTDAAADALAARLESVDFAELPVVVLSTDLRATTRAWVAGRERAALLHWRDYRRVDAALARLLDDGDAAGLSVAAEAPDPTAPAADDATDIDVLVVDDAAGGRRALRDLLAGRGYRVALAASAAEALARARGERFEIVLVDFHLGDASGDGLCRTLLADARCGEPLCVVLTDAYGDALIRRCLAAGAIECLFRGESRGLTLARIDALARVARRRRASESARRALERALGLLGGAALLLDADGALREASPQARALLDLAADERPDAGALRERLGLAALPSIGAPPRRARLRGAGERVVEAVLVRLGLGDGESLLRLGRVLGTDADDAAEASPSRRSDAAVVTSARAGAGARREGRGVRAAPPPRSERPISGLPVSVAPFLAELGRLLAADGGDGSARASLLVLGVFERGATGEHGPVSGVLAARVSVALQRLYRHERHVGWLGAHRVGVILRHADEDQAWRLTQRLARACAALGGRADGARLASVGCLLELEGRGGRAAGEVIGQALRALALLEAREAFERVLLLDRRRLLVSDSGENGTRAGSSEPAG